MKLNVLKGATSVMLRVFIQDSSSATGAGLTGLVFNSAGLTCYRARDDDGNAGGTAVSLVTATRGTWVSGGFVEKDATNMPGWYELYLPNNAFATGSRSVGVHMQGATNMAPLALEVALTDTNDQDGVRGGMTALPNAAAAANGGLPTVDANNSVKFQGLVKRNTALTAFPFMMTDSTTHNPKPGLGTAVTATVSIDGAAFVGCTNGVTETSGGWYKINLAAADVNGATIALNFTGVGADVTPIGFTTVP